MPAKKKKPAAKKKKAQAKKAPPKPVDEAVDESPEEVEEQPLENLTREETAHAIYALLFASDRPLNAARIAEALGDDIEKDVVENLLEELREIVEKQALPFTLREIAGGYQLTTRPKYAPYIRRLFQLKKKNRLSRAVLETLAIIAYRQPVTRPDVESIRGVSVSHAFNQLQERHLIKAVGHADVPGRPRLYRTTDEFLDHFGIKNVKDLPSIEELREMR